jgi:alpha-beta hydrolase superfamily lysophospholipase
MEQTTGAFQTPDHLNIYTTQWLPDDSPNAVVILIHGISEHSGRYQHVAEALATAGYAVYALDHRGHGKSNGERVQINSNTQFMSDLKIFFDSIHLENNNQNIFLLGHSMGSVIALQFALKYQADLTGIIVTGTGIDVGSTVAPMLRNIANTLYRLMPHAPIAAPISVDILTSDPQMQQRWRDDTLIHRGWTPISTAKYIIDTGEAIQENASKLQLPILIMHGGDDKLTPVSGSHILHESVGSTDKTLKIWPEMQHEIMNEVDRQQVLAMIIDWLNQH